MDEAQLLAAIDARERPRVEALCEALIAHVHAAEEPYPLKGARRILDALRGARLFVSMQLVADAFLQTGRNDPVIRRQYGQALLDQGNLSAAVAVLTLLRADTDGHERSEARGLLGRAYKQMYIAAAGGPAARRRRLLEQAIAEYRDVYVEEGLRWHGINAVALLSRARRDGIALEDNDGPGLAREILTTIEELGDGADMWDYGTALEACVALGETDQAVEWLVDYLRASTDAFSVGSTLRQLREVWALSPTSELGARVLPVLQAELLAREGGPDVLLGVEDLTASRAGDAGLEKVLGKERFDTLKWFRTAIDRSCSVARVEDPIDGGLGTGFLVDGAALKAGFPERVLLTNAHVIPGGLAAARAQITFRALGDTPYGASEVLWTSPPHEFDTTILALDGWPDDAMTCPIAANRLAITPDTRTYIIGHPGGDADIKLSVRDNQVLAGDDRYLHYRTPTLGGSSGSPVFNRGWELVAIHHAGDQNLPRLNGHEGTYPANEGIWISAVIAALT